MRSYRTLVQQGQLLRRCESGNAIIEAAIILPFVVLFLFVSVELLQIYRAGYALHQVARIGAEAAETAPSFERRHGKESNVYDSDGRVYEECTDDYFITKNDLCSHIIVQTKMYRALMGYRHMPLENIQISSTWNNGSIETQISADYRATFGLTNFNALGFSVGLDLIRLSGKASGVNFRDLT